MNGNKLVQPKPATIISTEALKDIVSLFLKKLGYESTEIDVENHGNGDLSAYVEIKTGHLKFNASADA